MTPTRRGVLATGAALVGGCLGSPVVGSGPSCPVTLDGASDARIAFVGDVMLGRSVTDRWVGEEPTGVWGSTLPRLRELDGLVLNLECCISDRGEPWPDKTYHFRADPSFAVPALEALGTAFASLANNHTLDFGQDALADTRRHLSDAGIAHAGAGPHAEAAYGPTTFAVGDLTVGVLAFTDQFAPFRAGDDEPGTAYVAIDPTDDATQTAVDDALATLADADPPPDLVVATLHWGPNWETEPVDGHRRFARWLVDQGVDVVHGHSAHVLQGVEVYRGRPIIYDAGDFVDDYVRYEGFQNKRSALFELAVRDGRLDALRLVPVEIIDERATLASGDVAAWVRETMRERSAPFETTVERAEKGLRIPLDC